MIPEQAANPISVQCPTKWFQILLNCEKQQFVSCTSNLLEQMYDFQKCTMFLQKWISNLQDLPRSQNLETVPICIVWQYYPNDNIVRIHLYDELFEINRFRRLSQALVHIVMDRASLFTDHKISGRPIRAKF